MSAPAVRVEGLAYLVCATQRSGSTLLCELLKGTEVAGVPDEYFEELRRYTMLADAGSITCPAMIVECADDFAGGGGATLQQAMTAPATLVDLGEADGAAGHCGGLGQTVWEERVYDWLAGIFGAPGE